MVDVAAAATALKRALARSALAAGTRIVIHTDEAKRWSSATFEGAKHTVILGADASLAIQTWLERLKVTELAIVGHLIADLQVTAVSTNRGRTDAYLEVLTVRDE